MMNVSMRNYFVLEEVESVIKGDLEKKTYDTRFPLCICESFEDAVETFNKYITKGRKVILCTGSWYNKHNPFIGTRNVDFGNSGVEILRSYHINDDGKMVVANHTSRFILDGNNIERIDIEKVYTDPGYMFAPMVEKNITTGRYTVRNVLDWKKRRMVDGRFHINHHVE